MLLLVGEYGVEVVGCFCWCVFVIGELGCVGLSVVVVDIGWG